MTTYLSNRRANFDYDILHTYEAGLVLLGHEVKSIRAKKAKLEGAHILIRGGEAYVVNFNINPYQPTNMPKKQDANRVRKLLLSRKELLEIERYTETNGLTAIPLRLYSNTQKIKIEIAVVRGKKKFDKRESIKARDVGRDIQRTLRGE